MFKEYRERIFLTRAMLFISETLPQCDPDYLTKEQFNALSTMLLAIKGGGHSPKKASLMIVSLVVTMHNSRITDLLDTYISKGITG